MNDTTRRIWLIADPHIGHVSDGRDGGDWLELAMNDRRANIPADYAINLGDCSHGYQPAQFRRYVQLRDSAGLPFFDLLGNHDFHGTQTGDYQRIVSPHRYWSLIDGNVAFFSLPAERGNAAGLLLPPVEAWLREQIRRHDDKNIIIAAHQFPYGTVEYSTRVSRCMHPRDAVERLLAELPISLWLGGHIHMSERAPSWSACRNGTVFVNVASASHSYNKNAANSCLLELRGGSADARVLCRDHDRARWLDDHATAVRFRYPCEFSTTGPVFTPFALDVPDWYSRIEEEQVTGY